MSGNWHTGNNVVVYDASRRAFRSTDADWTERIDFARLYSYAQARTVAAYHRAVAERPDIVLLRLYSDGEL